MKKRRCIALLLALVMAFSLTSGAAMAEEDSDSSETTVVEESSESEEEEEEETTAVEEETEETAAETEEEATTAAEEETVAESEAEEEETTAEEEEETATESEAEEEETTAEEEEETEGGAPDDSLIVSIQATSMPNFYGQKLGYVTITYADGTDMSTVSLDDYVIYDRGFSNPDFGEVELVECTVEGTVVTLTVDTGSDATAERSRETYGSLCTSSWYIDTEGTIYYGSEDSVDALGITIKANTSGKGYQARENLDLILCTNGKEITEGIASTDGAGTMLEDTVWEEMILGGGLDDVVLELVDIGSYAEGYTLLSDDGLVPVQVIYPDDYDPDGDETYTTIVYQCGGGVCYWELTEDDGYTAANNLGCNVVYDEMMTKWHELMPDAIIISVNVHSSDTETSAAEIAGVLDYGIENWNIDADGIVIVGNSQGTIIASDVIRQRPDLISAYVECNGNFGANVSADTLDGTIENSSFQYWTEEELQAVIDNEISVWMFNGETDGSNPAVQQDTIEILKELYREAGKSEEWIDLHVRASGLQSWKFIEWGESDHSVTKIVATFYLENAYTDVWEDGGDLEVGDTYTFAGESDTYAYYDLTLDYEYTVYGESVSEWAQLVLADEEEEEETDSLTVDDIVSIQATTDGTIYGTGVVEVEIVYADDVDLTQYDLSADSYVLTDRGSLSPDYGEVPISDIEIDGQTVTLIIDDLTAATDNNTLVYTGDDAEGSRERNVFGIYCTNAWYRDVNGVIYYGDGDEELGYEANTTGMGYQTRASLELKLRHADEDEDDALCLADENGEYTDEDKWLETIDLQFGEDGFQSFEELGIYIESTANNENITDGTDSEYVLGYAYIPEDYDPENGIIFILQGQGICYWQLGDGTNNAGTSFYYDNSSSAWAEATDAIVVNINDRSSAGPGEYWDYYDFVVDDVNVMKYFIETYGVTGNIVLQGNSRGTMACSIIIKALAGEGYNPHNQKANTYEDETYYLDTDEYDFTVDTFICNNGYFCYNYTDENYEAVAATGLRIWAFDGEQDVDNYDEIAAYTEVTLELYGEEWVEENVHLTGYNSEIFYYWGESDHSVTRLNGWYFYDSAYYGPSAYVDEETGEIAYTDALEDGDTYTLECRGKASGVKDDYVYEIYDEIYTEWALLSAEVDTDETAIDFDTIESLDYDYSQAAQLPLTGYFTKTVTEDGRTVKVYISEEASIRSYFTVVAVPDGVDTYEFLEENGYIDLADEKGECLFILEPGEDGWGSAEEEAEYLEAAMGFLKSPYNDYSQNVFSTYGEFYLVGYGKGAAALELWAAANPIYVISQTYIDGESVGTDTLTEVAEAVAYDGSSSYGDITDVLEETIEAVGIDGEMTAADVPVPTYLINYTGSEEYWQTANDCVTTGTDEGVYYQDINSDAYATEYANGLLQEEGAEYGISLVEISSDSESADAASIYAWLSVFTRYDNVFAYSNYIYYRLDYTEARVAAQQEAKDGTVKETLSDGTEIWGSADVYIEGHGTVQVGVIAFSDNDGDGEDDPREYIIFIPEGYEDEELPLLMIYPGNSQTDSIYFDCSLWWQVAEENGIALVFICETYSSTPSSVSHADSDLFYDALITIFEEKIDGEYAEIDFTRIYGTGQSAGSIATQGFAVTDPEMFAAVASTSAAPSIGDDASYEMIPTMMISGQMDASDMADGFDSSSLQGWANYMLEANGLSVTFSADTASEILSYDSRHSAIYSWNVEIDGESIPLVQWGQCALRAHNFYPSDVTILWDFLEHYSCVTNEDGTVTRYYSASAFEEDDLIELTAEEEDEVADLDDVESLDIDYSQAAQLPLTGYFTKTVTEDGRTVKVYISEDASIRSYFTVVAVPDGVDTYEFLEENGYFDLADEKGECLYILEPGEDGWGSAEEEADYIAAAISFLRSPTNDNGITVFSTYGEFYFIGYGKGAAALELWAAANPIYVISQTYIDGESVGSETLQAAAEAVVYDGSSSYGDISDELEEVIAEVGIDGILSADEVPIPTYLINYTGSEEYWQTANDCVTTGTDDGVYYQDINSDAYATEYANGLLQEDGAEYGISLVEISSDSESADAASIYAWLSVFTRYDNVFAYSNYIAYRLDYTAAHVEAQQEAADGEVQEVLSDGTEIWGVGETYIEGHGTVQIGVIAFSDNDGDGENDPREYLLYIPEGYEDEELPVVVIYPGNTQTVTIFMDCSLWWQVAEENGFAIVFVGETYSAATAVTHSDTDLFYDALMTILEEEIDGEYAEIDFTRIYGTGQSLGSMTTQGFAVTDPEMFAAVASTSGTPQSIDLDEAAYELIPVLLINGAMDLWDLPDQFDSTYMQAWASYMLEANGLDVEFSIDTVSEILSYDSRHSAIYSWNVEIDGESIPLVQFGETALRSHNFYPSDITILWDFLEHYSMVTNEDGTVTRYYSASAFEEDDLIELTAETSEEEETTEATEEETTAEAEETTTAAEETTTTAAEETTTTAASTTTTTTAASTTTSSSTSSSSTETGDQTNAMMYVILLVVALGAAGVCGGVALKKRRR